MTPRHVTGAKGHGGHQRQDPKCLLRGYTSTRTKDIQEYIKQKQIEQAVLSALENLQKAPADPLLGGNTLRPRRALLQEHPPSPPPRGQVTSTTSQPH